MISEQKLVMYYQSERIVYMLYMLTAKISVTKLIPIFSVSVY